jgi:TatD DNase family protein
MPEADLNPLQQEVMDTLALPPDWQQLDPSVVAAAGVHPNDVAEAEPGEWERIVRLVDSGRVAAVGETGLDWYRTTAPHDLQREWFARHLELARRSSLPVVIHTRESIRDTLDMLRDAVARGPLRPIPKSGR